jgi:CubicO group peptidase (beta-lactamase class C family)
MKKFGLILIISHIFCANSQLYFPPLTGTVWETTNPSELGWCQNKIDSLYAYLESQDTKAFIVLKDGKIVLEQYFNGHAQNTPWYWASAGKTITAFLVGIAQQEGFLNINNPSSDYLGAGWTSCTSPQENAITVWHQLTMTTGLDDSGNLGCILPSCLQFLANPGTRWSYHNAPYTLLDQVIAGATGTTLNLYTTEKLKNPTGMTGSFVQVEDNNVFFSSARSMARFGLLVLNNGNWNGTPIMTDTDYFADMINTSQELNKGYGYLWWLNGKENYMLPSVQITIPGSIMPNAPDDMVSGLGKDGQFVNVVPSQNLVLIRMGEEPSGSLVPFMMNDKIWEYMNDLICLESGINTESESFVVYPNPSDGSIEVQTTLANGQILILDLFGRKVYEQSISHGQTTIDLPPGLKGVFLMECHYSGGKVVKPIVLQ